MELEFGSRLKHAWNAFRFNRDPTRFGYNIGTGDILIVRTDYDYRMEMSDQSSLLYSIVLLWMRLQSTFSMFNWMRIIVFSKC